MRPVSSRTSTPSSMVLKSVSRKLRSRASRSTTLCKPSLSSRPIRSSTLPRKLDLGVAILALEPMLLLEPPVSRRGRDDRNDYRQFVAVAPAQLRHVVEVHSVPCAHDHER